MKDWKDTPEFFWLTGNTYHLLDAGELLCGAKIERGQMFSTTVNILQGRDERICKVCLATIAPTTTKLEARA